MPMLDIQRRHQTVFRIRFGEKQGNRPSKLTDAIRVTSANADVVDAFIAAYGGTRKPWEGQFEAKLPTTSLNILVLPGQSISQWWEKYRGSVCERRCDGKLETKSGKPCMCDPDVEVRTAAGGECAPTTRVSVICPDVAVVGSGMFVCHGLVGAETLPQSIAVAEAALSRGLMVPAVLRVVEFRGRNHFIVPQIEVVGVSFNALAAAAENGQLQHATRELEAPAAPNGNGAGPRFTPVPTVEVVPPKSIAAQFGEFEEQSAGKSAARAARSNASAVLPPTGVPVGPRGASGLDPAAASVAANGDGPQSAPNSGEAHGPSPEPPVELVNAEGAQAVAMRCADAGVGDDLRAAFLYAVSQGRYRSSKQVPVADLGQLYLACDAVKHGNLVLVTDPNGEAAPQLLEPGDVPFGTPMVVPQVEGEPPPSELHWRELLGRAHGVGQAKLLRAARELATSRDLPLPVDLNTIPAALAPELRSWLEERSQAAG